jgi:hypothetical protein
MNRSLQLQGFKFGSKSQKKTVALYSQSACPFRQQTTKVRVSIGLTQNTQMPLPAQSVESGL